ncbi:MAG TPA: biosynthetic peptidoglycan transglycosylase, partial [Kofleriaceae bacterium]|nr:biosynthetic peptidoglycan transglycosylase [Kofleriaceae bacterium]
RDRLTGLRLAGTVAGRAEIDFTRADDRATRLEVDLDVADCRVLGDAVGADPRSLKAPFEHTFPDGSRGLIGYHDDDGNDGSYVTLRSLPDYIPAAWVAAEDARFFRHRGFDPQQIERSLGVNLREGELVRGGSTISQQLVKNVFLSRERNIARKLQEAVLTWRMEATVDKRLILERYLNLIELGPGVFGVAHAARYWFDKDAQALTVAETAFLVALTPAPTTMSRRVLERQSLDPETASRVRIVLRHMRAGGVISEAQYERARRTEVQISPRALARR